MTISILDLSSEIGSHWEEFNESFQRVLKSCQFIGGPEVEAFESEVARYLGVKHAVGVNSGTDALIIGLKSVGVCPGDEVICPSFTFFATVEAVSQVGATPVFVDIDPGSFNVDPALVEKRITEKTKAILPVHLFGYPVDMGLLRNIAEKHNLCVVEDTAQAFGASCGGKKAGTVGNVGAFSFFPSKNLAAFGDGGLIVSDDDNVAVVSRKLRSHGSLKRYDNEMLGYNSRLDAIQAAILRIKLRYVDGANEQRQQAAHRYQELLSRTPHVQLPSEPSESQGTHVYHQYTIRITNGKRDEVYEKLLEAGIQTMIYYPIPVHRLKAYELSINLPETERACAEVISLPMWPTITPETQVEVVNQLFRCLKGDSSMKR